MVNKQHDKRIYSHSINRTSIEYLHGSLYKKSNTDIIKFYVNGELGMEARRQLASNLTLARFKNNNLRYWED